MVNRTARSELILSDLRTGFVTKHPSETVRLILHHDQPNVQLILLLDVSETSG